jgi:DNA replication protein DnaC
MTPPAPVITGELRSLLRAVKLGQLLPTLPERLTLARANGLGHAQFLELILSDEVTRRDATSAQRRARAAGLDAAMRLDRFDDTANITCDRAVLDELFTLRFVAGATNAIIMGPVGVGKTFLATALGHAAIRARHTVWFERAGQLLKRLKATRLDNSHDEQIRKLLHTDLLILDDFCLQPMDPTDTAVAHGCLRRGWSCRRCGGRRGGPRDPAGPGLHRRHAAVGAARGFSCPQAGGGRRLPGSGRRRDRECGR